MVCLFRISSKARARARAREQTPHATPSKVNEIHKKNQKTNQILGSPTPQEVFSRNTVPFWYCVPGNFFRDPGGVASWKARAHDERSDKGNTVGVATWGARVA